MIIEIIDKSVDNPTNPELDVKEVWIQTSKYRIVASKESSDWNSDGINKFLINVAISTPDEEQLEINFDNKNQNSMYKYIVDLFNEFALEFNKTVSINN